MKIIKEKTTYHTYALESEYNRSLVEYCQYLKSTLGWQEFQWDADNKKWRFKDIDVIKMMKNRFPEIEVDQQIQQEIKIEDKRVENAQKIKEVSKSTIELKGIKGNLYEYQKIGIEFLLNSGGRALIADSPGCIGGDEKIIVNRGGNARTYTMRELYKKTIEGIKNFSSKGSCRFPDGGFSPKINSKTRSLTKDGVFRLNVIERVLYSGVRPTIIITAKSKKKKYKIRLTEEHEIYTPGGKWVQAKFLKEGDYINIAEIFLPDKAIITKIEKYGDIDVYDLVMKDPNRNFIVNGIVVHNCGKSVQALGYIAHSEFKRSLIVCPASVKFSWENEIDKWTKLKSFVVDPQSDLEDIPSDVNCIIVNFDILKKFFNEFMKYRWDCLIGDEIHLIKSSRAIRTKIFKSIAKNVPNVVMLTGTPVLSRPIEIFNVLNIIDPKTWNNYYQFAVKYCEGHQGYWGFEAKGASNLEELKGKINKYFLRRTKEEVLKQLPPKNRVEVPIELEGEYLNQYEMAENDLVKYLRDKKDKSDREIAKSLQAEKLVRLNFLREINAMGKIKTVKEIIDNIIEAEEKVLIFSSFNAPLKELYEYYGDSSVLLLGETSVDERKGIVDRFQNDSDVKIFLGGTRSAGVGITLTAASNVIFLDLPWNPADLEQSENRAHRPGATYESLNIYQIISHGTIDGFMKKLLQRKQEIIDQLITSKETESDGSEIDEYIKLLEQKYRKT